MRASNRIVLASQNHDKFLEMQALLKSYPDIKLIPLEEMVANPGKISHVEKYETYLENAIAKAQHVNNACHYPALADDSGLEVEHLQGKPGVRTHRFAIAKAGQSQDQANIEKLLESLKGVPMANRKARFVCALALVIEGVLVTAQETLEGTIAEAPMGTEGFGYDPLFIPQGSDRTLAEMAEDEKNTLSHRAKALHELMAKVRTKGIVFVRP